MGGKRAIDPEVVRPGYDAEAEAGIFLGDCFDLLRSMPDGVVDLTVTSPPYCIGKRYETTRSLDDFQKMHERIAPEIARVTKPGGSVCWQVGYHVEDGVLTPLDAVVFPLFVNKKTGLLMRNRIVWTFGHGLHCSRRFSGRHEMVLWFSKGANYKFNLDPVRVPQKYPGKRHHKGKNKGEYSGNPLGKNPEDVWNIPNVKANHVEKTEHPCQFPMGLVQRLIRALTSPGDLVLDPFAGSGTTGAAAISDKRRFIGAELDGRYYALARRRLAAALDGTLVYRDEARAIYEPTGASDVEKKPPHFK